MSEETDELYRCGLAYESMEKTSKIAYKIKFFAEDNFKIQYEQNKKWQEIPVQKNTSHEINIIFTPDEFYHLSGLHKFLDMKMKSETAYKKVLKKPDVGKSVNFKTVSQSQYFFDDIDESNNAGKEIREPSFAKSNFLGRLLSLENLYSTISQSRLAENSNDMNPFELKIYAWDRTASDSERPHNSTIQANFLIEIYDKNNLEKPYIDFFIVRAEDGTYRGMSIFPSDVSNARDDIGKKASEITTLSLETFIKGKSISVISADDRIIADCRQRETDHNERVAKEMLQDPHKEERKKFFSKLGNQRSQFIKKDSRLNKENYYKMVEIDLFSYNFSEFDLKSLKSGMEQSLNAPNTSEKKRACLEYEIATVEIIIELKSMMNELEQLLNQEDFSIDAYADRLFTVSAYLVDKNVNIGSNLVLKVADLIEQQKENCNEFTAGLIDDAVTEIKQNAEKKPEDRINFNHSSTVKSGNIKMMQFHNSDADNSVQANITLNGAVAIPIYNPFRDALRSLAERLTMFVQNVADKIQETLTVVLHKPQNTDTVQPESAPETENENAEKDSNNESHYIVMDGAGIQSYGDYFTVVPVSELNFQVPLIYEMEHQQKKQDKEQEISAEKSSAPIQKKKQAEYDDF